MTALFRTSDGRLNGLRVGGCIYMLNVLFSLIGNGWRSLSWIAWLLMAFGFFVLSPAAEAPHPGQSKWRSPRYLAGVTAVFLGVGLLLYRLSWHLH